MSRFSLRIRRLLLVTLGAVLLAAALFASIWFAPRKEKSMPDELHFGALSRGATVQFGVRMLTSDPHPLDRAYYSVRKKLPVAWLGWADKFNPRTWRTPHPPVDLAALKPQIEAPKYLRLVSAVPRQELQWYEGRPFIDAAFVIDTSQAGTFAGEIKATLGSRRAKMPVAFSIREQPHLPRVLIVSPFTTDSTDLGTNFAAVVRITSTLPAQVDFVTEIPISFDPYAVVLFADAPLTRITDGQMAALQEVLTRGGRVILHCNYFYRGTVAAANQLSIPAGLSIVDVESTDEEASTNITRDLLTTNVHLARFHRASPIQLTSTNAKSLVTAPDGTNSYAAVSRTSTGGELVVVTQSLWWFWVDRFATNSDNSTLLRNLLTPRSTPEP